MPGQIEWTEVTWNPTTGCDRISAGCDNCYALTLAKRLKAMGAAKYQTNGDLFYARVPLGFVREVFAVIAETSQHAYQAPTKRSTRLRKVADRLAWPPNLWMGVSVEDAATLYRVDDLRTVSAAVRFVSCEPLLGPLEGIDLNGIGWVIAGGESGPRHRPVNPTWVAMLRDSCLAARVPFFFDSGAVAPRNRAAGCWMGAVGTRCRRRRWRLRRSRTRHRDDPVAALPRRADNSDLACVLKATYRLADGGSGGDAVAVTEHRPWSSTSRTCRLPATSARSFVDTTA